MKIYLMTCYPKKTEMKLQIESENSSSNGTLDSYSPTLLLTFIHYSFNLEFNKLPFDVAHNKSLHATICSEMAEVLLDNLCPFEIGGVAVDGSIVVQLVNELISQIRGGGNKYVFSLDPILSQLNNPYITII